MAHVFVDFAEALKGLLVAGVLKGLLVAKALKVLPVRALRLVRAWMLDHALQRSMSSRSNHVHVVMEATLNPRCQMIGLCPQSCDPRQHLPCFVAREWVNVS